MPSPACAISSKRGQRNDSMSPGEFGPGVAKFIMILLEQYRISEGRFRRIRISIQVFECFFMVNCTLSLGRAKAMLRGSLNSPKPL